MTGVRKKRARRKGAHRFPKQRDDSVLFDPTTISELIELFTLLLLRCGVTRTQALAAFQFCIEHLPDVALPSAPFDEPSTDYLVPGEVLTQWHVLPQCVQKDGKPRPLAFSGKGFTFTTLVQAAEPHADPKRVREYLLNSRCIVQVGARLVAIERKVRHRLSPHLRRKTQTLAVLAQLRTVENNERQNGRASRWFQFTTDGKVPESQLEEFKDGQDEGADQILFAADDEMHRRAANRRRGERLVPMHLGIYMSEMLSLQSLLQDAPTHVPADAGTRRTKRARRTTGR
jgi:hypothetical protein